MQACRLGMNAASATVIKVSAEGECGGQRRSAHRRKGHRKRGREDTGGEDTGGQDTRAS